MSQDFWPSFFSFTNLTPPPPQSSNKFVFIQLLDYSSVILFYSLILPYCYTYYIIALLPDYSSIIILLPDYSSIIIPADIARVPLSLLNIDHLEPPETNLHEKQENKKHEHSFTKQYLPFMKFEIDLFSLSYRWAGAEFY